MPADNSKKQHWETVYADKNPNEVSWTQENPISSLRLISNIGLSKAAEIIDIGGGDSQLVDFLLNEGYVNLTVLDISLNAIGKARARLGKKSEKVNWLHRDMVDFIPTKKYDVWHDRAAFHFLTKSSDIKRYVEIVQKFVSKELIIACFSKKGPLRCSGLDITQYDIKSIKEQFKDNFELIEGFYRDHQTPFNTSQNFLFARFRRIK